MEKSFIKQVILPLVIFMGGFEYLMSVSIFNTDVRVFHLLILTFSYRIFLSKVGLRVFLLLNFILAISIINFLVNFHSISPEYLKVVLHQELFIVSLSFFCSFKFSDKELKKCYTALFISLFVNAIFGLLQFFMYSFFSEELNLMQHAAMGDHLKWRVYGFFSEPNWYSVYFAFGLILFLQSVRSYSLNQILFFGFPIALSLLLSFSRGVFLALIITFLWWVARERGLKLFVKYIIILVGGVLLISLMNVSIRYSESLYRLTSLDLLNDPSSSQRIDVFIALFKFYQETSITQNAYNFVMGSGLSSFRQILWYPTPYNYFAMNFYVDSLFELGVLVTILVVIVLIKMFNSGTMERVRYLRYSIPLFLSVSLFYPIRSVLPYQLPLMMAISIMLNEGTSTKERFK